MDNMNEEYDLMKRCPKCGILSLKSNFHEKSRSKDGLIAHCKFCQKI